MDKFYKNSKTCEIVSRDIRENMLNHSYMLISNDGEYVKILAKQLAMQILCKTTNACGVCDQCIKVEKNEHADVVVLPNDRKNIVTEDIDKIVSESYVMPLEGDYKIYVLNNFDQATVQAQNKLLKTLEEPPKSVVFIITTTNDNGVLATIKSRCKKINEREIPNDLLQQHLIEKNISPEKISEVVDFSDGNLTRAEQFLNNDNFSNIKNMCYDIINKFEKSSQLLSYATKITEFYQDFELFLNLLLEVCRKLSEDMVKKISTQFVIEKYNTVLVYEISQLIQEAYTKLKSNVGITSIVDNLLLGILEVKHKCRK